MDNASYASGVFNRHFRQYRTQGTFEPAIPRRSTCLELGPGDSLLTAMLAKAAGFERTILVDDGHQIRKDMGLYVSFSRTLRQQGVDIPLVEKNWTLRDFLREYSAEYRTGGLASLAQLPDASVDFSFSHAVLEHVPRSQAGEYLGQFTRLSKPDGVSSHHVDLKDHLGGSLQHLRFSTAEWENDVIRRSGVYTNRLRYSQWRTLLEQAGVRFRIEERTLFPIIPLRPHLLAPEFRTLADEDLRTSGFHVVFKP